VPPTPLRNPRQVRWWGLEGGRGWPIAAATLPMARATVPDKGVAPHAHRLAWARWRLRHSERHPHDHPPNRHDTKTRPLHMRPPVHRNPSPTVLVAIPSSLCL
jgi:hypothetical protein